MRDARLGIAVDYQRSQRPAVFHIKPERLLRMRQRLREFGHFRCHLALEELAKPGMLRIEARQQDGYLMGWLLAKKSTRL
jgi:hypothetical protein